MPQIVQDTTDDILVGVTFAVTKKKSELSLRNISWNCIIRTRVSRAVSIAFRLTRPTPSSSAVKIEMLQLQH